MENKHNYNIEKKKTGETQQNRVAIKELKKRKVASQGWSPKKSLKIYHLTSFIITIFIKILGIEDIPRQYETNTIILHRKKKGGDNYKPLM